MRHIQLLLAAFLIIPAMSACKPSGREKPPVKQPVVGIERRIVPPPDWLKSRAEEQLATSSRFDVFHDFHFTDELPSSGISFRHRIVDCAGYRHKAAHYDHGNGVVIADVDSDGKYDIYFSNQVGRNQLWRNLGGGKFEDITEEAGVADGDRIGVSAAFADIDNDGDPDLYVTGTRAPNVLYENDGTGHFTNISESSGVDYTGHSSAAVFFDYDRDGLLDLFLCNVGDFTTDRYEKVINDATTEVFESGDYYYYVASPDAFGGHLLPERTESSRLYRNQGGNRFVDVTAETGLEDATWNGDAIPLDVNEDGWLDLYLCNMQGHDQYYENVGGEKFEKKGRDLFLATPWGSMGAQFFDFNNDGKLDLYVTDMHTDMAEDIGPEREKLKNRVQVPESMLNRQGIPSIFGNAFYLNQGDGTFTEVSDEIGAENYWPWGLSVADLNADGYNDVFITASMNYPFRYGVNSLLLNNRGQEFLDSEFILGVEPRAEDKTEMPWFEVDCSVDKEHRACEGFDPAVAMFRNNPKVTVMAPRGSRSSVIFDLDDDGDLDIVANEFNSEPLVFISDLSEKTSIGYLKIQLEGSQSNRDGLGARVTVQAGSNSYVKVYDGQSGYLSQSLYPLYFGLGEAKAVDQIEVVWPSGQHQVLAGPIPANQLLKIKEPEPVALQID
jgi:hypothetical protein